MALDTGNLVILAGNANPALANKIADRIGVNLCDAYVGHFNNGETQVMISESIRGKDIFIIQPTSYPVNDNLMELLIMADACKRASAHSITAVVPYYAYARQDRKTRGREPISAKLVANLMTTAGCTRVVTVDLHAGQIQGFFDIPVDHIYASKVFIPYLKSLNIENLAIAAPDMGGAKRANAYAKDLACPVIICHKSRERANVVASITAIGEVEGKNVVIVDDMIDTAGTLTKAADILMEKGAKSVRACATHAILSGPAYDRINKSSLSEVYVTDTIPLTTDPSVDTSKIKVVSMTETFARIIRKVCDNEPISPEFIF